MTTNVGRLLPKAVPASMAFWIRAVTVEAVRSSLVQMDELDFSLP
jgi:hypothetical protein